MDTPDADQPPQTDAHEKAPRWSSEDILQGRREAIIVHGEDEYRLRWTRNDKLILYK